jgi:hypothetical protein
MCHLKLFYKSACPFARVFFPSMREGCPIFDGKNNKKQTRADVFTVKRNEFWRIILSDYQGRTVWFFYAIF